ncbi:MAG: FAD-binding oxidoreductase [Patescibacteria group bacterium]
MLGSDARNYFSTDASILKIEPSIVVYPRNENDVRKTARFSWQLAERGRVIPITARGSGTDQSGAALGSGIMLVFPAHMNRILELDNKSGSVIVEPGINYGKLQQALHTHNRFLPPYPASMEYSTIGGAVANNASGERSFKYGATRGFVRELRVVLANGEVIETRRLNKRELNKKLGLASYEGEIYRTLDSMIEENKELIANMAPKVSKNSAGYALNEIRKKDGSFDLSPLFVGSQGTLGIVTEIQFDTEPYNPHTTLVLALCDDWQVAEEALTEINKMGELPSAVEAVDSKLLDIVQKNNPNLLKDVLQPPFPKLVLLIEFDNTSERVQKKLAKKVLKILQKYQITSKIEEDPTKQEELWKIRHSAASLAGGDEVGAKAIPFIEDGIVPMDQFQEYVQAVYGLFETNGLQAALWGHAGNANLHIQPFLNLAKVGDRQKVFRLMDDYYNLVLSMGGSTSAEHNDGRIRAPYLEKMFGPEVYELFKKVKQIFDPYGTLNPGVKLGTTLDDIKQQLRSDYNLDHLYDHMPRS